MNQRKEEENAAAIKRLDVFADAVFKGIMAKCSADKNFFEANTNMTSIAYIIANEIRIEAREWKWDPSEIFDMFICSTVPVAFVENFSFNTIKDCRSIAKAACAIASRMMEEKETVNPS